MIRRSAIVMAAVVSALASTPASAQVEVIQTNPNPTGGYIAPGGVNPGYYQGPGSTYGHAAPGYFGGYNARATQPGLYNNSGISFNADGVPLNPGTTTYGAVGYGGSAYSGTGYYGFTPYYPREGYTPPYRIFPQPAPKPAVEPLAKSSKPEADKKTESASTEGAKPPPAPSGPVLIYSRDGVRRGSIAPGGTRPPASGPPAAPGPQGLPRR